jgi:hypothetical protein
LGGRDQYPTGGRNDHCSGKIPADGDLAGPARLLDPSRGWRFGPLFWKRVSHDEPGQSLTNLKRRAHELEKNSKATLHGDVAPTPSKALSGIPMK